MKHSLYENPTLSQSSTGKKIDREVERMLKNGIIKRSTTHFINLILPVIKKDSLVCLCIDARELNQRLQPDRKGPEEIEVLRK